MWAESPYVIAGGQLRARALMLDHKVNIDERL
jgi:hypothetical protein